MKDTRSDSSSDSKRSISGNLAHAKGIFSISSISQSADRKQKPENNGKRKRRKYFCTKILKERNPVKINETKSSHDSSHPNQPSNLSTYLKRVLARGGVLGIEVVDVIHKHSRILGFVELANEI
jgi:hypothetical protein